jgi:hypothetical protein
MPGREGALALGVVSVVGSGGALFAPEAAAALSVTALAVSSSVAGGLATSFDARSCFQGDIEACIAVGLGSAGTTGGLASAFGLGGAVVAWGSWAAGAAATGADALWGLLQRLHCSAP